METWLQQNWNKLIKGILNHFFCGQGFYAFLFEHKEYMDLIFSSDVYFFDHRGMYLNRWNFGF